MPDGAGAYLRSGARVRFGPRRVLIRFGFWQVDLPRRWTDQVPGVRAFLAREISADALTDAKAAALVNLLDAQGALSFDDARAHYRLDEIRSIFGSLMVEWYADYYRHPLWTRLRDGRLGRRGVAAWMLRTYHLSRSAGVTAARAAASLPQEADRAVFLHNGIEEYDHCRRYFSFSAPDLGLSDADARRLARAASSRAFDEQMLRLAEHDPLAHALVCCFQEQTASYLPRAEALYAAIERHYRLDGRFASWQRHIGYDLEACHADHFWRVFEGEESIKADRLRAALTRAWATVGYLQTGLAEILDEDRAGEAAPHRHPVRAGRLSGAGSSLVARVCGAGVDVSIAAPCSLTRLTDGLAARTRPVALPSPPPVLIRAVQTAAVRALGFAESQAEVLAFGALVERGARAGLDAPPVPTDDRELGWLAVGNFLIEAARRPCFLAACLVLLSRVGRITVPQLKTDLVRRRWSELLDDCVVDAGQRDRVINEWLALAELAAQVEPWRAPEPMPDPFGR